MRSHRYVRLSSVRFPKSWRKVYGDAKSGGYRPQMSLSYVFHSSAPPRALCGLGKWIFDKPTGLR